MRKLLFVSAIFLVGCSQHDVERSVRDVLKDPASAEFRAVAQCPNDARLWKGEVNAKNGFGAYVGFSPFFYDDGEVILPDHPRFEGVAGRCYGVDALPWARQFAN